jgi:hypothetical protein
MGNIIKKINFARHHLNQAKRSQRIMKKAAVQTILKHAAVIGVFLLITIANFFPQIQGKVFPTHDIISFQYMSHEATEFEKETGEVTHWTNAMFGGMPTYQISSPVRSNLLKYVEKSAQLFLERPIGYFFSHDDWHVHFACCFRCKSLVSSSKCYWFWTYYQQLCFV